MKITKLDMFFPNGERKSQFLNNRVVECCISIEP